MHRVTFESVSKSFGGQSVITDFSLDISPAERVVLLGPSGCGKTTILRLLAGFIVPDKGSIQIDGFTAAADGQTFKEPPQRNVGMVFQDLALWPHLTVEGNLEFGLKARGIPPARRRQKVADMLERVHLSPYRRTRPGQLSGGQQQRVALARALILQPKVLLMDEPLSSLDRTLCLRIRKEILTLQNKIGFTLLFVTHNREEAFEIGNRVVVMHHGAVKQIGSAEQIKRYLAELDTASAAE